MGFRCGIVGLPNVGKSTLFNALTETAAAQAANYPFCTIEPNVGEVAVPDPRLDTLAKIAGSKEIIPTRLTFVDIAGLVRGASKGEGLGNKFLANIRETDAIAHVVRCFADDNVIHVHNRINPIDDIEIINMELALADLDTVEKVLLRDFQVHAYKQLVLHADFQRVDPNKKIHVKVPLHFINAAASRASSRRSNRRMRSPTPRSSRRR